MTRFEEQFATRFWGFASRGEQVCFVIALVICAPIFLLFWLVDGGAPIEW